MDDTFVSRYYIRTNNSNFESLSATITPYTLINQPPDSRKLVSRCIDHLTTNNPVSMQYLKVWEKDLGVTICDEGWGISLKSIHSCSINSTHQLINFKVIHRLNYSCTKPHSYPSVSPMCQKCHSAEGTLGHLFWSCPKLHNFWSDIFKFFSAVYSSDITLDPNIVILGGTYYYFNPLATWLVKMSVPLHMERIRYNVFLSSAAFDNAWQLFLSYISKITKKDIYTHLHTYACICIFRRAYTLLMNTHYLYMCIHVLPVCIPFCPCVNRKYLGSRSKIFADYFANCTHLIKSIFSTLYTG